MGRRSRARQTTRPTTPAEHAVADSAALASPPADWRVLTGIAVALVAAVFAVFAQLRNHAFLNFDDPIYVTSNDQVRAGLTADGIGWAITSFDFNWHPLTWLTHMLDVELFGLNAGAHLLVNVAWHAATTVLLLFVLRKATGSTWRSAIVAAVFAVHPLHVESVAWLSERKDVLSAFFFILAIWFYLGWVATRSKAQYVLTFLAMTLGLMAKGMVVTLPFVLLLLDYWPLRRFELNDPRALGRLALEKLPLFGLTLAGSVVTFLAQRSVESLATTTTLSPAIRVANAFLSYVSYLAKTFWPANLAIPYDYPQSIDSAKAFGAALLVLLLSAGVLFLRKHRYLFTGWFWFVGMLVPVIGVVQIGHQSMADRYTYLPQIGLAISGVWLIGDLFGQSTRSRRTSFAIGALALAALAVISHRQASRWRDSETLFRHATRVTSENSAAHMRLAGVLIGAGRTEEAAEHFRAAVRIAPRRYSEAYVALSEIEMGAGRTSEAAALLRSAITIDDNAASRGALASAEGNLEKAVEEYGAAVREEPNLAGVRNDFAATLARAGRDVEALRQYKEAIRLDPDLYDARMNLGALLSRLERNDEAALQFTRAASLRPGSPEPHVYLALLHASSGRIGEAIANLQRAIAADEKEANLRLTNAIRIPFAETNIRDYLAFLESQPRK